MIQPKTNIHLAIAKGRKRENVNVASVKNWCIKGKGKHVHAYFNVFTFCISFKKFKKSFELNQAI